jgi:hypothetical protein
MPTSINNPGGGDCGFYAYAIGLIAIMQEELRTKGVSATAAKLHPHVDQDTLNQVLSINLSMLQKNPHEYMKDPLDRLQMALRHMTLAASKARLEQLMEVEQADLDHSGNVAVLEGHTLFGKFMELVRHYFLRQPAEKIDALAKFNELALSPAVLHKAEVTAETLREQSAHIVEFADQQKLENRLVKEAFVRDVDSDESTILTAAQAVTTKGQWATHGDLQLLSDHLQVALTINGHRNGNPDPTWPIVTLENHGNNHWTTAVDTLEPVVELVREPWVDALVEPDVPPPATEAPLTAQAHRVIEATVSSQAELEKVALYREHLEQLVLGATQRGLFKTVKTKIRIEDLDLDLEDLNLDEDLSDEEFAKALQEAELRKNHLIP